MGSKNKLRRFRENEGFANVIQPAREEVLHHFSLQGNWSREFKREAPLILELGCGKGEYTVGLARKNPDKNYIGIDIKGARFWRGAKTALEEGLDNVRFLRTQVELVDQLFGKQEVDEIWITFPDPQIKYRRTKHRLTGLDFLEKYRVILKPKGLIHLKTDSEFLHGYTLGLLHARQAEILYANHDLYHHREAPAEALEIQTFYENQYLQQDKPITYIQFRIPGE